MMNITEATGNDTDQSVVRSGGFDLDLYMSYHEYKAAVYIWKILPPFMIIFGTVGNFLSIHVLTRKNNRTNNSFVFLTALAISDTLVLYSGLLRQWIVYTFNKDIREIHPLLCKLHLFIVYFALQYSAWLLVLVTSDRVLSTWIPHKFMGKASKWTPIMAITLTAIILVALNTHFLYGFEDLVITNGNTTVTYSCQSKDDDYYKFTTKVWPWIDLLVFCLIPFLLLFVGNILIFIKVMSTRKAAMTKIVPSSSGRVGNASTEHVGIEPQERSTKLIDIEMISRPDNSAFRRNPESHQGQSTTIFSKSTNKTTNRVTKKPDKLFSLSRTLIILNTSFLVLNMPVSVYLIGSTSWYKTANEKDFANLALVWAMVNILSYSNNTINFLLYCLSGTKFRHELRKCSHVRK